VDKFCYVGDMLRVDEDVDAAVENRIRIQWNKFRQLARIAKASSYGSSVTRKGPGHPLLTNKDISLKVRGRLYSSCVQSSVAWK